MGLHQALDSDDTENYLTVQDASDKVKLDAHQHGGGADGLPAKLVTATGRIQGAQGANVASSNNLTLGTDGNLFTITGTTQINLLDSTGWQNGSVVVLDFAGIVTVKHGQVASSTYRPILLASGVDFVAAANSTLTLALVTANWKEIGRKA